METWNLKNGSRIFRVLSGRTNAYLLQVDKRNVLIDTGRKKRYGILLKNIKKLSLSKDFITDIILTHSHYDHCQNVTDLVERYCCNVIMNYHAQQFASKGYTPVPMGTNAVSSRLSKIGSVLGKGKFGYKPFSASLLISEDTILKSISETLQLISTPGHSTDSMSVIVNNEIALVGDTLFGVIPTTVFPPYADDIPTLLHSWAKLLESNCRLFLPGHGKPIKRKVFEKEYEKLAKR